MVSHGEVVSRQPLPPISYSQQMEFPGEIPGVPTGLEYLASVDQLIIKQEVSVMETITGIEAKNRYRVMNAESQQAYCAVEESDTCHRIWCGPGRGFVFHITDNQNQEVMSLTREFVCCGNYCPCCSDGCCIYPIIINDKFGQKLGMVRQMDFCCSPVMGIFDADDTLLYQITGPCCPCQAVCCTDDVVYPISNVKDDSQMARITKIWDGCFREICAYATTFGVHFPIGLDVKHKALMLGAVFLVDFSIFEKIKQNNK